MNCQADQQGAAVGALLRERPFERKHDPAKIGLYSNRILCKTSGIDKSR